MNRARFPLRPALLAAALTVLGPALPALAQPQPAAAQPVSQARHADWTTLLARYVKPGADGLNRFDYGALKASAADTASLNAYIARIAGQDWASLPREEQFVSWANLYNAVTIQHIIGRYPLKSIRDGYVVGPWKEVKLTANGRTVSLDDIEHAILRKDWSEPRVHYMVNCASVGCPNLMTKAWETTNLEADLDVAARAFINSPRGVVVRKDGRLTVSTIYKWFREDFGGNNDGVIAHIRKYADADLTAALTPKVKIAGHAYDWTLNDTAPVRK